MTDRQRRGRHRRKRPPNAALVGVTSAIVATSIAAGAGAAYAVPEQGGTTPQGDGQEQGGTAPDTTGTPEGTAPIAPIAVPGPGSIPAPPQEAPYQP